MSRDCILFYIRPLVVLKGIYMEIVSARAENCKLVGSKLTEKLSSAKITRDELAKKLGVSRRTIYRWEIGENEIPFLMMLKICVIAGFDLEDFDIREKMTLN